MFSLFSSAVLTVAQSNMIHLHNAWSIFWMRRPGTTRLAGHMTRCKTGCVRVLENLKCPRNIESQNPGLGNLENHSWSLKVLENQVILWAFFWRKSLTFVTCENITKILLITSCSSLSVPIRVHWETGFLLPLKSFDGPPKALSIMSWGHIFIAFSLFIQLFWVVSSMKCNEVRNYSVPVSFFNW